MSPEERLSLGQALRGITIDAAFALKLDHEIGSIVAASPFAPAVRDRVWPLAAAVCCGPDGDPCAFVRQLAGMGAAVRHA